jgi:hypothetical protein
MTYENYRYSPAHHGTDTDCLAGSLCVVATGRLRRSTDPPAEPPSGKNCS